MKYYYGKSTDKYLDDKGLEYLINRLKDILGNDDVNLINYYNKTEIDTLLSNITGTVGADGRGIQSIDILNDELKVTLTDSTVINLGNVRGAKGDKGDTGAKGTDGINGADGKDGVGITTITKTSTDGLIDTYTITYTDNTTSTFTLTNGKDGLDGTGGGSSGGNDNVYSTEEVPIGTWIDGKTIYRNVFDLGTLPSVTNNYGTKNTATGVSLSTVIDIKVIMTYGTTNIIASPSFSNVQLNPSSTHSTYVADVEKAKITLFRANNNIMFYYGKDYGSYSAILVVEYTKTV